MSAGARRAAWSVALIGGVAVADPHTFRFDPPAELDPVESVGVAGTFNSWSRDASPLSDADGDGVYEATLDLPDGVHHYKFVVDGSHWLNDPASDCELEQGDGHGGVNSAVLVGPDARKLPPPRPNHINLAGVLHDPADPAQFSVADDLIRLGLRTLAGDVERVKVTLGDDTIELHRLYASFGYDLFGGQLRGKATNAEYTFELIDGRSAVRFDPPETGTPSGFRTPEWAKRAVWYQVFPERFRDGDPANNPPNAPRWTADWYATLEGETPGAENFYRNAGNVWNRRYGGDLQGVREALPYLRGLGVNAIYFNPIFEATSPHKYDAVDHRHIDDNFGVVERNGQRPPSLNEETDDPATWRWTPSDLAFLDFLDEAHRQGFRVIIDGVWNHVGIDHFAFQDVLKRGRNSRYASWFEIIDWGDSRKWGQQPWWEHHGKPGGIQWKAWDRDNGDLPTFAKDPALGLAPGPREHIMAVTRRWTAPVVDGQPRRGVDGWRLDVPHDIPMPFWRDWRNFVKELNPDALLVGEVWGPAHAWLQGDTFDAVMNYQFAMAAVDFFVDERTAIPARDFLDRLVQLYHRYPLPAALAQQNLIASHDTDRLASMFLNPDRDYDQRNRLQDGHAYNPQKPRETHFVRMRQAMAAQFVFPGAPMTYYGDEAGLWGPDDPDNRKPMIWKDLGVYDDPDVAFDAAVFSWHQRLASARRALPALQLGHLRPVLADDAAGVVVFARDLGDEHVYIAFNRSPLTQSVTIPLAEADRGHQLVDYLDPEQARIAFDDNSPRARPHVASVRPTHQAGDAIAIDLRPWATAVLARPIR